jgi:hypothetical protein
LRFLAAAGDFFRLEIFDFFFRLAADDLRFFLAIDKPLPAFPKRA